MNHPQRAFAAKRPDGCPPDDASDANGSFFRFAHNCPPDEADYETHAERGILAGRDACLLCGLSLFSTAAGAEQLYDYLRRRHRGGLELGKFLIRLELTPGDGKVKQTNRPPHHTWAFLFPG